MRMALMAWSSLVNRPTRAAIMRPISRQQNRLCGKAWRRLVAHNDLLLATSRILDHQDDLVFHAERQTGRPFSAGAQRVLARGDDSERGVDNKKNEDTAIEAEQSPRRAR